MRGGRGRQGGGIVNGEFGPYHDVMVEGFEDSLGLTAAELEARLLVAPLPVLGDPAGGCETAKGRTSIGSVRTS